jgi:hypothetical protein
MLLKDSPCKEPGRIRMFFFFSKHHKSFLHNQNNQQVVAALAELMVLKSSQTPKANSQTYEKYYKVEEDLMQCLCSSKSHGQNDIKENMLNCFIYFWQKQHFNYHATCIWLSYPLLESLLYEYRI